MLCVLLSVTKQPQKVETLQGNLALSLKGLQSSGGADREGLVHPVLAAECGHSPGVLEPEKTCLEELTHLISG